MAEQLSVLIIGAGTKGAFGPVSHAQAFKRAGYKILGFYDKDREKAVQAAEKWGGIPYDNMQHVCRNETPDVISIAVSDNAHSVVIDELIYKPFRLLFVEKPFGHGPTSARCQAEAFKERNIPIAVNYTRRFIPALRKLAAELVQGSFGEFLGGSGFYGKGLYHNGSHMLDLLAMLLGDVQSVKALGTIKDGNPEDPSVSAILVYDRQPFYMGVVPRTFVNAFDITLYFQKAAIRLTDCGRQLDIVPAIPRIDFPQENVYGGFSEAYLTASLLDCHQASFDQPMYVAVKNIADHLNQGVPLLSTAENAIKVLEICEELAS
jgi:predicted dehydrogenase